MITFAPHENGLGIWRGSELIGVIGFDRLLRLALVACRMLDERG
jgi:hypothetical protein